MIERLPQDFIPTQYDLYLHIIPNVTPIEACVTITFKKNKNSNLLILHMESNLTIKTIIQNNQPLHFYYQCPKLTIVPLTNPATNFIITIEYTIQPKINDKEGLYIHDGNYITHLEPNYARQLLPCFDEPSIRSIFNVTIKIPSNLTGISNMPTEKVTKENNSTEQTIKFQPTPPMCTYLLCICVGHFSFMRGITAANHPVNFYFLRGQEEGILELLQVATFSVDWMETYFKVPYELPVLQFLFYEGCFRGMENYGLIILEKSANSTFYMDSKVIMHETVHQWFGDLVEIKWWDSIWLNEGFAEFIEILLLDDYFPEFDAIEYFTIYDGFFCFKYFKENRRLHPSLYELTFDNVLESFVYAKGSFVLKMFYDIVGRDNFFNCCSYYLNSFKNKNADISDFINSVNLALKKDFSPFFNTWLNYPRFPVLTVNEIAHNSLNGKKIGVTISQTSDFNVYYQLKIPIVYGIDGKIERCEVLLTDFMKELFFEFDWIIVNDNFASLCYVIYSKVLLRSLIVAKNGGNLNKINRNFIACSISSRAIPQLVDRELFEIARQVCN